MADHTTEKEPTFAEILFGFKVDPMRVLAEQAVCMTCGGPGLHAHATPPGKPTTSDGAP